ncbi:MAG: glutamine--fructose-6-phosphate transaminase (isomerizing) [Geodermatophilaceae bacterium]
MCGIIGYVGAKSAEDVVLDGLRRMEYRGYDSAGIAVVGPDGLAIAKKAGKLANLEKVLADQPLPSATTGMGHTRWATHGPPVDRNAHPHVSADRKFAVVHNGIIENFAELRSELERGGLELSSDTDTEVVAHLLADAYESYPSQGRGRGSARPLDVTAPESDRFAAAMRAVCRRLEGAFTLVAVHSDHPGQVVGARRNSPLVAGIGDGEYFLGSDVSAFIAHTRDALELGQDEIVTLDVQHGITVTDFEGNPVQPRHFHVDWDAAAAEKGGYPWFMLKEIAEQPAAIADTLRGRLSDTGQILLDEVRLSDEDLRDIDKVFIVACGTANHAAMVAKYAIEHWSRLPCEVELASQFRYRDPVLDRSTLVIAVSQSGETMDTLMALRHAKDQRARVLAICNTNGSTIPRESDAVLYTRAVPEVAVASTKAFLAQLAACYLVALYLAQARGTKYADEIATTVAQLNKLPEAVAETLNRMDPVRAIGRELAKEPTILFVGRHVGYPVALEGALKLKELAYIHAEGFAAGELKHGYISLIEEGTPVVAVIPARGRNSVHSKVISNIQEMRARGAKTIVIAADGDDEVAPYADHLIHVPKTPTLLAPVLTTIPMQVLACEIADMRGLDVDQPRNLAKSVTVE